MEHDGIPTAVCTVIAKMENMESNCMVVRSVGVLLHLQPVIRLTSVWVMMFEDLRRAYPQLVVDDSYTLTIDETPWPG